MYRFGREAIRSAWELPAVASRRREKLRGGSDVPGADAHSSVRMVDVGGAAGGAKAVDPARGFFLKTPDNAEGIYPSDVLAAKATKLEVHASAHVH